MYTDNSSNGSAEKKNPKKRILVFKDEISEDEHNDDQVGQYDSETEEDQSLHEYGEDNERKRVRSRSLGERFALRSRKR